MPSFFKVRVGDGDDAETFELPSLTLGEARLLKAEFGMADFELFNPGDPDQLTGLLYLCLRRKHPDESRDVLMKRVEEIDAMALDVGDDEDPPVPAGEGGDPSPETTPAGSGGQS